MARWFGKRWVWAALTGATVTAGLAAARGEGDGPPKVGATMALNIDGKGERQFKVVKSEKQPDGTYLSELKDTKTGETITLVDKPGDAPPAAPKDAPKLPEPPKAKPRTNDPLSPPVSASFPDAPKDKEKEKEKEKRPLLGRIFGDRDKDKTPAAAMPGPAAPEPEKKGLLGRVFGPKKPSGPSMPAATAAPVLKPGSSTPPPVLPVPPGGLSGTTPPPAFVPKAPGTTGGTAPPAFPGTTAEPPRVMPNTRPVTPPAPAVSAPLTPPPTAPAFPTPMPTPPSTPAPPLTVPTPAPAPPVATPAPLPVPMPSAPPRATPVPTPALPVPVPTPALPAAPGGGAFPPIPVPPGGTSAVRPLQVVVPAGYVPAGVAFDRDVQPFVIALQSMSAPSARLTAAKGLAECRHSSTEGVKGALFQAARMDPCGEVRAACITHLCELGYFSPHFLGHIQTACDDADPQVREAAKAACAKMIRK